MGLSPARPTTPRWPGTAAGGHGPGGMSQIARSAPGATSDYTKGA
jgi:hypothetical protein